MAAGQPRPGENVQPDISVINHSELENGGLQRLRE